MSTSLSQLERTLLSPSGRPSSDICDHLEFLQCFFQHWPISTLLSLSRTNLNLHCAVKWYIAERWNVHNFLGTWFPSSQSVLRLLDEETAVVCGTNVIRFFNGCVDIDDTLDVYATIDKAVPLAQELAGQGYAYHISRNGKAGNFNQVLANVMWAYMPSYSHMFGQTGISSAPHRPHSFLFKKVWSDQESGELYHRFVMMRLVRCQPYKYVLSQHSTMFMNYITADYAVSLFPYSTLVSKHSFVVAGSHIFDNPPVPVRGKYIISNSNGPEDSLEYQLIGGPPTNRETHEELVVGPRFIGDKHCLTVPVTPGDPLEQAETICGPSFEIYDFRSGAVKVHSYAGIREFPRK